MNLSGLPRAEEAVTLLEAVAKFIEAASAPAHSRFSFQQTDSHASLREQGRYCKSADAPAHNNNFTVHVVKGYGELR
jgi:hypothetical protein